MPDRDDQSTADPDELPSSSLHAYKEGRKEDVSGDAEKLESNDPQDQQADELEGDDEGSLAPEKH
ncbi:MAG: hypothetical protein JO206_05765 [Solirubrobacterales bacterium]|nr:hypothetical protein [Solirubrobacterales bacterium]MBV9472455.1 hypothetical protein [Solirubrobacterales bacterium]MBV9838627.1 hypothetical protein [Solirubrobacterales bacterium]